MSLRRYFKSHKADALRVALSYFVTNGLSAALGLLLISGSVHLLFGPFAAAAASVGVLVCIPPDQPAPKRGKFWQLLPALLIGLPLFLAVQVLHAAPVRMGLLLVPASFLAFLAGAWGNRGLPIAISAMFAMVFSMAVPAQTDNATVLSTGLYFATGGLVYLLWATLANAALNSRYRVQMLADTLLALAQLMRTQARQFTSMTDEQPDQKTPLIGALLRQQAALADQLQTARNILLESPRTLRRQQLASMLMLVLEMRDHLLVCELDLDALKSQAEPAPMLGELSDILKALACEIERLADDLLQVRLPNTFISQRQRLASLRWDDDAASPSDDTEPAPGILARGLARRIGHLNDEVDQMIALERGEMSPDVGLVRTTWALFVSPTTWSWQPVTALWSWKAPSMRHAIRAALAIGTAYALSLALPWGTHDYWILLTIVVVLRGSLAQTLERRNSRVAGTLIGCVLAGLLLYAHIPPLAMLVLVTLAQAFAHAFAIKRYLVTAVAATVLGLLQVHMLNAGSSASFDLVERMADTLIGVAIAWAFSYVLPSWERHQITALVTRTLTAQARHARVALDLWQLKAVDNEPELQWRLARREAYDSLSALVQATQRSLSEPRAVRPPLEPLGRMLAYSYQLLAQLTSVKTMLLRRRGHLNHDQVDAPLRQSGDDIAQRLIGPAQPCHATSDRMAQTALPALNDPFEGDVSAWMLRRLDLSVDIAGQLRHNADEVIDKLAKAQHV